MGHYLPKSSKQPIHLRKDKGYHQLKTDGRAAQIQSQHFPNTSDPIDHIVTGHMQNITRLRRPAFADKIYIQ